MSADDHLSAPQFLPVSELLGMHSTEALAKHKLAQMRKPPGLPGSPENGPWEHGEHTRVRTLYDEKARGIAAEPELYHQLDEPIRNGTIDPVVLERDRQGNQAVYEGHHRIVRAHQLGVERLPVSNSFESQQHYNDWDN